MALSPSRDQAGTPTQRPGSSQFLQIPTSSPQARSVTVPTVPMTVPNTQTKKSPPPPLPPPRYVETKTTNAELVHRPVESDHGSLGSASIKSGSSLLGGSSGSAKQYTGPQRDVDLSLTSPTGEGGEGESGSGAGEGAESEPKVLDLDAVVEYK